VAMMIVVFVLFSLLFSLLFLFYLGRSVVFLAFSADFSLFPPVSGTRLFRWGSVFWIKNGLLEKQYKLKTKLVMEKKEAFSFVGKMKSIFASEKLRGEDSDGGGSAIKEEQFLRLVMCVCGKPRMGNKRQIFFSPSNIFPVARGDLEKLF
jgi:hypothetical protein